MGMIGGMAGAAGAGTASIIGGILSSRAANKGYKEALQQYNDRLDQIRAHRDNLYYQDPTQSAESQAAVTNARELLNEQAKRTAGINAVAGGTDESVALQKEATARAVGNMLQQQAVEGAAKKEGIWNTADQQINQFSNYIAQTKLNKGLAKAKALSDTAQGIAKSQIEFGKSMPW